MKLLFWLRWAWRDLGERWLQVIAIALIIAVGTGIFAGLGGQESWRLRSLELTYEEMNLHDLRVRLTTGSYVDRDEALAVLNGIDGVARVDPRLLVDTLIETSNGDETIVVAGRLVGVDCEAGGPFVDTIHNYGGRMLDPGDEGVAVLETKFADYYDVGPGDRITLIGGNELEIVGLGLSPEYIQIVPEEIGIAVQGEANLAVLYVPLATTQAVYDRPGMVNDLRLELEDGADRDAVRAEVERRMGEALPGVGAQVTTGEEDPVRVFLESDAVEDQEMLDLIAVFFLIGAALAAFNLAGRIVESQRRQIGIGMALGAPRSWLAFRPLLVGLQIALIGTVLGLLLGMGFTRLFTMTMEAFMPMPGDPGIMLHPQSFLIAAALGIVLPLLATMIPIWQAGRTEPLEALHGHLAAKSSGLNRLLKGVRLPGGTLAQMPLKNVLRSPKRTLLTIGGLAVAVALLFLFMGLLDTLLFTLEGLGNALLYRSPDRMVVTLNSFYPVDHEQVRDLSTLEDSGHLFAGTEPFIRLRGQLRNGEEAFDALVEFIPADSTIWVPRLEEGRWGGGTEVPGIVIAQKAAEDLGVAVGDTVALEHPYREGPFAFHTMTTDLRVTGIHDNPVRKFAYIPLEDAAFTGLNGLTNALVVIPGADVGRGTIRGELFGRQDVIAIAAVAELIEGFDDMEGMLIPIMRIMQGGVVFIAFLIAFNSTSINIDDRRREVATMFAFGTPPGAVTWVQVGENVLLGLFGTLIGGAMGWFMLNEMLAARMEVMMEELGLLVTIGPLSLVAAVLLGIGAVALTPLLSARKLRRIDIPSTLRVME
jgi:putative ABC transport system permease protein